MSASDRNTPGTPGTSGSHVSRLALGRLMAGDLDAAEKTAVEAHLAGCPACGALLREAEGAAAGFASKYPSLEYLAATRRSRRNPRPEANGFWEKLWGSLTGGGAVRGALAAMVLFVSGLAVMRYGNWTPSGGGGDLTAKGEASFYLFVNGRQVVGDTVRCGPGDTLQLGILGPKPVHYAVLYQDDGGALLAYMPGDAPPVGSAKGQNLPHSLVLEGTWAREDLHCLWSDKPLTPERARERAMAPPSASGDPRLKTYILLAPGP